MIEIMIVVGIIIILAGIGLAVGMQVKRSSADQATKAALSALDQAMGVYLKDHQEPTDELKWFQMLQLYPPSNAILQKLKYHYDANKVPDGIVDAFGEQVHYKSTKSTGKTNGFFVSGGPDGKVGVIGGVDYSADDVYSEGTTAQ
jgi:type II secretory pathway pseudopilin PulG